MLLDDINAQTLRIAARSIVGVQIEDEAKEINGHVVNMLCAMTSIDPPMPGNRKWRGQYECHEWVALESGFDPTASESDPLLRADYQRSMSACLEARDYVVK